MLLKFFDNGFIESLFVEEMHLDGQIVQRQAFELCTHLGSQHPCSIFLGGNHRFAAINTLKGRPYLLTADLIF